jgi:hypothetical protein
VTRISRQPTPVQIMIHLKQPANEKYFNYSGNITTNEARCISEIKSWIAIEKAAFCKKKTLFSSKSDLNLRKKIVNCYIRSVKFVWCCKMDTSKSRLEILGKV